MADHGQREAISRADATRWYDYVAAGVLSEEGLAAAHAYHVSPALVLEAARLIAEYIAAGETEMRRADTIGQAKSRERKPISVRQALRVVKFLEARGYIKLVDDHDMMRALGLRGR